MDDFNPYESPKSAVVGSVGTARVKQRVGWELAWTWSAVFVLNLIVPVLFGWMVTNRTGRLGMALAVALLLVTGCCLCATVRRLGTALVIGGVVIGLSQLFPFLQFMAGLIALVIGKVLGQVEDSYVGSEVISDLGGFVVTLMTGLPLIGLSMGVGLLLRLMIGGRWWTLHPDDQ